MKRDVPQDFAAWLEPLPRQGDDASLCPRCQERSVVMKTAKNAAGLLIRYRTCIECGLRYTTVELICFGSEVSLRDKERTK